MSSESCFNGYSRFKSVHYGHVDIHENEFNAELAGVVRQGVYVQIKRFLAIVRRENDQRIDSKRF